MARLFLTPIDLGKLEILNPRQQQLGSDPGSPVEGQFWWRTDTHVMSMYNGTTTLRLGRLDQITAPTASVDLNSQLITNLATPTLTGHAATKGYVDGRIEGLSWKNAVRAATTTNGALATAYENTDVIDGVTLATNDRILLKDQTTQTENGIYTVNASGAPTRAVDADTAADILQAAVFVQEGTANAETRWVLTNNAPITIGSTNLSFVQWGAGSAYLGGAGLVLTSVTFDVVAGATAGSAGPGGGLKVNADDIVIDTNVVVRKYAVDVGDNSSTSITITHNLGTVDVTVALFDKTTPFAEVIPEVRHSTTNTVTLVFGVAPTTAQYRCVVHA